MKRLTHRATRDDNCGLGSGVNIKPIARLLLDFEGVATDGALARRVVAGGGGGAGSLPLRLSQRFWWSLHLQCESGPGLAGASGCVSRGAGAEVVAQIGPQRALEGAPGCGAGRE